MKRLKKRFLIKGWLGLKGVTVNIWNGRMHSKTIEGNKMEEALQKKVINDKNQTFENASD